jgi:hypothetical protein
MSRNLNSGLNSYLPNMGSNSPAKPIINNVGNALNSIKNVTQNIGSNISKNFSSLANSASNGAAAASTGGLPTVFIVFGLVFLIAISVIYMFYDKIRDLIPDSFKYIFGGGDMTPIVPEHVVKAPPTNVQPPMEATPASSVEAILPGKKEVFNVSSNRYTYGDAEPLCRALGAQLATYDQVKASFDGGADWCNYGWSKGQLALFPTQKETYDKLQLGPEGQRQACGRVGLNGGYFDNPDMRFGVNCYGIKPNQSQHDASATAKGAPISPDALEFDKKVSAYKSESDSIGVLPWREGAWSS